MHKTLSSTPDLGKETDLWERIQTKTWEEIERNCPLQAVLWNHHMMV